MVRARSMKSVISLFETTMCADAMAFFWSSRQMCSSWMDSTPGIWGATVSACFGKGFYNCPREGVDVLCS